MPSGEFVKFDPFYVAKVLEELLSDQYGRKITITLTKKTPEELGQVKEGG